LLTGGTLWTGFSWQELEGKSKSDDNEEKFLKRKTMSCLSNAGKGGRGVIAQAPWVEEVRRLVIKGEDTFGKKVWIKLLSALSEEVLVLQ